MRADPSPRRRWHRTSVRTRAALGAGLASLAAFGLATFWVSDAVRGQWMDTAQARAATDAINLNDAVMDGQFRYTFQHSSYILLLADGSLGMAEGILTDYWYDRPSTFAGLHPYVQGVGAGTEEFVRITLPGSLATHLSPGSGSALNGRTVTLHKRVTDPGSTESLEQLLHLPGLAPQRATVFVLVSPVDADTAADRVTRILGRYVLPGATLFTALVAWWVTGLALRPVEGIRRRMARIGDGAFHERVPVPPAGDEISRLAVTTNATLDRLEHALQEQRRLVSDASHELRSPLAALRSSLEIPLAHPAGADWPQVVTGALADTERLQLLTDDLLLLAAADEQHRAGPAEPVDLADVVAEQLAERVHLAGADDPGWAATALEPAPVRGSEILLGRLVRNLLDNAGRYARSAVAVSVTVADGRAVLTVADDGPGIAPADRERVFDRFVRLDDARDRATGGGGLGLSLVRSIARNLGGAAAFTDPPLGAGARVVVRLPLAGDQPSG